MSEKVVFFDLDGTLYSYNQGHEAGLQGAYLYWKKLTGQTFDEFVERYHKSRKNVKRFLQGTVGSHSRALYFQGMFDDNFKTPQAFHIAELIQKYWDTFIESITPFDGVEKALNDLRGAGYRLAIITNMSAEIQFKKLHKLKLDNYFDAIITSEEAGQEKPHPHIYLHAVNRMKVKPHKCVMIGDDFKNDVEVAEFIGMKTILIAIEENQDMETEKVVQFNEIVPKINKLNQVPLEGVIKYTLNHRIAQEYIGNWSIKSLINLRDELYSLNLIGTYPPDHYLTPNVGFGNASQRFSSNGQFVISGSQTGDLETTNQRNYALVLDFDIDSNQVVSKGPIKPSSESMTHAAIYMIAPEVEYVIHVHHEKMWFHYKTNGKYTTPEDVPYGTPAMANAIQAVYRKNQTLEEPVCMLGHIDGLLTWGKTLEEALGLYKNALEIISNK